MSSQLLCTFTNEDDVEETLSDIQNHYDVIFGKIFVLQDKENPDDLFCTYNIEKRQEEHKRNRLDKTISIHRKKETNTIYTINALNSLIIMLNGRIDETYPVPWENYQNEILLTINGSLREIPTKLYDIRHLDDQHTDSF